jgi:hypothetical protein
VSEWQTQHEYLGDRDEWIEGMREMLTMLEDNPELPIPRWSEAYNVEVEVSKSVYNEDTKQWEREYDTLEMKSNYKEIAKVLYHAGSSDMFSKYVPEADYEYGTFRVSRTFAGGIQYDVRMDRSNVCQRVKVGTTIIPAKPGKWVEPEPERTVDKYEYECGDDLVSILK